MALVDFFPSSAALDPNSMALLRDTSAQVYDISDTSFTAPLELVDLQGVPMGTTIAASTQGFYPDFRSPGHIQVIAKSADHHTPLISLYGLVLSVIPDPSESPDNRFLGTQDGEFALLEQTDSLLPPLSTGEPGYGVLVGPDGESLVLAPFSAREVELRTSATHIQSKYVGDAAWTDLVALSTLKGSPGNPGSPGGPGPSPQLRVNSGFLQSKLPADSSWTNLVSLTDIGAASSVGLAGDALERGVVDWGIIYEGSEPTPPNDGKLHKAIRIPAP